MKAAFRVCAAVLMSLAAWALPGGAAWADGGVKIGSILSVTGPAAFLGEDMKAGMELAIDEINAKGGVLGKKIDWVFYDAESQTQKGLTATRRLLDQDKVDMIVGGGNMSGMAIAMLGLTEKAQLPFMSTEGAMDIVTPVAERQWTFKSTADDEQVMERLADYFAKKGIRKIAFLGDSSGFGQSAAVQLKKVAARRGLDVMYESFNPSDTDMTPQLGKIKEANVQAIVCWTVTPAGVVFLKEAQQLGLDKLTLIHSYGFVDQRYMKLAGDAAKNLLLVSVKFPVGADLPDSDPQKARIAALTKAFEAKFHRKPNQFAAQTYDAIYLAKTAFDRAGSTDHAKVRNALEGIHGWQGVGGVFNFSKEHHSGLSKDDLVLVDYHDGAFHLADYK
ncbi:MAG TPA: ABC transporter substrate-binding protein [Caldimonas sp.]|nr:ABC transporter substrate-binding protein [Caldimonas sp.]